MNENKQPFSILLIAELYLIIAALIYWVSTALLFNPVALILLALLVSNLIWKNTTYGFVIGGLLVLLNLYMFLALAFEFRDFSEISAAATQLLLLGALYLSLNLIAAIIMAYQNLEKSVQYRELAN